MYLIDFLPPRPDRLWQLARQSGITHCVIKAAPELTGLPPPDEPGVLARLQRDLAEAGITLIGLEGDPFDMARIKFGREGRDEDIARYRRMLNEMGRLGMWLLCYNFMAGIGWHRTRTDIQARGGALVSGFDLRDVPADLTAAGIVPEARIWDNYRYFLDRVLPAAEAAGVKMGAHPDDPPIASLRGIGRIMYSESHFDRVLACSDSPSHGLTFCQANWRLMTGGDARLHACIRKFVGTGRVWFVHLRDVRGTPESFEETFHDAGPTDMFEALRIYHEAGFRGPVRCDHVPTLAGEDNASPGYGALGRLLANGYLLGLMKALRVHEEPVSLSPASLAAGAKDALKTAAVCAGS